MRKIALVLTVFGALSLSTQAEAALCPSSGGPQSCTCPSGSRAGKGELKNAGHLKNNVQGVCNELVANAKKSAGKQFGNIFDFKHKVVFKEHVKNKFARCKITYSFKYQLLKKDKIKTAYGPKKTKSGKGAKNYKNKAKSRDAACDGLKADVRHACAKGGNKIINLHFTKRQSKWDSKNQVGSCVADWICNYQPPVRTKVYYCQAKRY